MPRMAQRSSRKTQIPAVSQEENDNEIDDNDEDI